MILELQPRGSQDSQAFRLSKIDHVEQYLKTEIAETEKFAEKMCSIAEVLDGTSTALNAIAAVAEISGIELLSTTVATPVVIALEGTGLALAGLSINAEAGARIARRKSDKHVRIAITARAKLESNADLTSKDLADNVND